MIGAFALTGVLEVQAAVTESSRAVCDVPGVCRLSLLHRAKLVETGKPLSELIKSDSFLIHWLLPLIITKQLSPRLPLNTFFSNFIPLPSISSNPKVPAHPPHENCGLVLGMEQEESHKKSGILFSENSNDGFQT